MLYSREDIEDYESQVDLTAKIERERRAAWTAPEQAATQAPPAPATAKRGPGGLKRVLAQAAAVVMISASSIAVYDVAVVQPRLGGAGGTLQPVVYTPVSYGAQMTVPEIIAKARPSVVAVETSRQWMSGTGSGVIMDAQGTILTNAHVVEGASTLTVHLSTGETYPARLIGRDVKTDLAVIKIEAKGLQPAAFGDSERIIQGELAVAIGNPLSLELEGSATQGIVSAVSREVEVDGRIMTFIQTDAAINPGNSGGALVNGKGEVIGINSVKVSSSDVEGLGFAIPAHVALPIAQELIAHGYVTGRPSFGITVEDVTQEMSRYYNVPVGVHIKQIAASSAAEQAGLLPGDIIVALGDTEIKDSQALNTEKDKYKPGDTVTLRVYRSGGYETVQLTLGEAAG